MRNIKKLICIGFIIIVLLCLFKERKNKYKEIREPFISTIKSWFIESNPEKEPIIYSIQNGILYNDKRKPIIKITNTKEQTNENINSKYKIEYIKEKNKESVWGDQDVTPHQENEEDNIKENIKEIIDITYDGTYYEFKKNKNEFARFYYRNQKPRLKIKLNHYEMVVDVFNDFDDIYIFKINNKNIAKIDDYKKTLSIIEHNKDQYNDLFFISYKIIKSYNKQENYALLVPEGIF